MGSRDSDIPGWDPNYYNMHRADDINARTLDETYINLSNTINTIDENVYIGQDSDGLGNPWLPGSIDWRPQPDTNTFVLTTEDARYLLTEDGKVMYWETITIP